MSNPENTPDLHQQSDEESTAVEFDLSENPPEATDDSLRRILAEVLPAELDTFYVVGSRSEANDLALRFARYATGAKGIVATRNADHGTTVETAAISPAVGGLPNVGGWVRLVDPTGLGGVSGDGAAFVAQVTSAAFELRDSEYGLAGMIVDPTFRSDGVFNAGRFRSGMIGSGESAGGLADAAGAITRAGGMVIIDETAVGLGRSGRLWAIDGTGIIPDILTATIPTIDGASIAIVAVRSSLQPERAISPRRFRGTDAQLVAAANHLSSIRDSDGLRSAQSIGDYLVAGLSLVASATDTITGVRGHGLLLALDSTETTELQEGFRQNGVLSSAVGPGGRTVLLALPLGFSSEQADRLVALAYAAAVSL